MDFSWYLTTQIRQSIGKRVEVATDTSLLEGVLVNLENDVIEIQETLIGYERETRSVFIALSSVNFIRAQLQS
ncbi:hypothetical protein H7K13_02490 [Priestia aryabhattai]|uniref:hypothetical protein n=1 Tax=Priestia TaxID=2800373 RepID=UPI001C8E817A|nr:hypothetical protein [Priestia aryabhattai]MBY0073791.1 hypothetical protein [Priestia aryabhattai]MCL9637466.1 hypothetical protein [Bacillus zanthoxyli]